MESGQHKTIQYYFHGHAPGVTTENVEHRVPITEDELRTSCSIVKPLLCNIPESAHSVSLTRGDRLCYALRGKVYQMNVGMLNSVDLLLHDEQIDGIFSSATSAQLVCFSHQGDSVLLSWIHGQGLDKKLQRPKTLQLLKVALSDRLNVILEDGNLQKVELTEFKVQQIPMNPLLQTLKTQITSVACGAEHVVALSDGNQVFTIGNGSRGQLGLDTLLTIDSLTPVDTLHPVEVVTVAAGGWHSVVLSRSGDIYAWGWNESGQVGGLVNDTECETEAETKLYFLPTLVDTPLSESFVVVSAGFRHSAAVSEEGHLYTWGWNGYAQLGHGDQTIRKKPSIVSFFKEAKLKVVDVICGGWSTLVKTYVAKDFD